MRLIFLLWLMGGLGVAAPPVPGKPINQAIADGSKVRYVDLLRLICPDLRVKDGRPDTATAQSAIGVGEVGDSKVPEGAEMMDVVVESVKTIAILNQGTRALVSFAINSVDDVPESRVVGLFDISRKPKLLHAAAVEGFPDDTAELEKTFHLNETTDAYQFGSYHHNSDQGYALYTLIFVRGDRIEKIADVSTLSCHQDGDNQGFEEKTGVSTIDDPGQTYRSVAIRVTLNMLPDDPAQNYRPLRAGRTKVYAETYRWNASAGRFNSASQAFKQLDVFNRQNN